MSYDAYDEEQVNNLYDEVRFLTQENARLRRTLEVVGLELKAYKERYEYILNLQAEALLLAPTLKIIVCKKDLEFPPRNRELEGSSAAEVAAKGKEGGMT